MAINAANSRSFIKGLLEKRRLKAVIS